MQKGLVLCAVFMCLAFWSVPAFSAPDMQEGLWEITMITEMPGMPAGMMQPMKHSSCLTKKDMVPQKKESGCTMSNVKTTGNTVSWHVKCDKGNVVSEGKITYAGTKFNGVITTTTTERGEKMQMKSRMSGKRVGPCK